MLSRLLNRGGGLWFAAGFGLGILCLCGATTGTRAAETNLLSEFTVRRWAVEDGLPEAVVTSVEQFKDGYLWCTTPHHLLRFDGVRFVEDETDPSVGKQAGFLSGMYADPMGTLWCYGSGGALRRDKQGWVLIPVHGELGSTPVIYRLHRSSPDALWAATDRGVAQFDGRSFANLPVSGAANGRSVSINAASLDHNGGFWLATERGLLRFQPGVNGGLEVPADFPSQKVTQVAFGSTGTLWVLGDGKLFCRRQGVWTELPLPVAESPASTEVTAMLEDEEGALWLGTVHGVYRWNGENWSGLTARQGVLFPLDVHCLAEDRERNVWVGTSGGLVRLRHKPLRVFFTGLPWGGESITALLAESPTNFWTAVAGGGLLNGPLEALQLARLGPIPENTTISSLLRGSDGSLWVGTQGDSLWRCRTDGTASVVGQGTGATESTRGISALLQDRRGRLWVGTWGGLMTLNDAGMLDPVAIRDGDSAPIGLPANMVHMLYESQDGCVWAGYQSFGLVCFFPDGHAKHFLQRDGLPGDSVRSVYQDAEGTLWVGTTSGLGRWDGRQWHTFRTANGLVDNVIVQILEDQDGNLWLGTRHGIMRVKKSEFVDVAADRKVVAGIRVFGLEAGMTDEQCTGGFGARAAKTADGRLWFPTMDGIVMVDPRKLLPQAVNPPVYIEEVDANGRRCYALPMAAPAAEREFVRLRLPRGARDVEFRFTTPVLSAPERAFFKYRLDGYDPAWSRAAADRTAHYPRLLPGEYRFQVMARDRGGAWSEPTSTVAVNVPAFFWETVWFWGAIATAALIGMALGVRAYYKRKAVRQVEKLERRHAIERERARIARDIHDDVGAGLTEMALLSELAQEEAGQPALVREHLDHIFQRSRELTQSLDEIVWAINPAHDTLESFLSYVSEFAQDFLATAGLACRLDLPPEPPALTIGTNVRHQLCLAVKEALHNTVKHAGATEVHLRVDLQRQELIVTIQDNGTGFVNEPTAESISGQDGLGNLETRLREIGGKALLQSKPGQGTRLLLSVKLPTPPEASRPAQYP